MMVDDDLWRLFVDTMRLGFDRIRSDDGDVTLYRPGSEEPFGISEYRVGTKTRDMFEKWESEGYQRLPNGKLIHLPYEEVTEILECLKS